MTTPTEHDHRAAIAANLDRIELPTYADAVRALPVLRTCGECRHMPEMALLCDHPDAEGEQYLSAGAIRVSRRVSPTQSPPSWCPLRGGER